MVLGETRKYLDKSLPDEVIGLCCGICIIVEEICLVFIYVLQDGAETGTDKLIE